MKRATWSKSLGNFFTIREVLARYDGETVRFFMLRTHYRSPFNFSDLNLDDARNSLRRLYTALDAVTGPAEPAAAGAPEPAIDWQLPQAAAFRAAMNDDFNTPEAVAVLFELAGEVNRTRSPAAAALLKALAGTLAVLQQVPRRYLQAGSGIDEARIAERIEARARAKKHREFALADQIRQELLAQGIVLQDSPAGTTWMKS